MFNLEKISDSLYKIIFKTNQKHIGNFIKDVDGYFYYDDSEKGLMSENTLKELSELLLELNKSYNEHLNKYFE